MRITSPLHVADRAAGRYRVALIDPARAERAVLVSLGVYVVLWTIYGTIAKGSQGLHTDMAEAIAWSRDLGFGYYNHPPLAGGIVWAWFSVFPFAEWSYYALAMLMPAIALWIVWRLSADYLDIEKRVVGLALLTLIPFFNFHALKFNVNTVLIPVWAATTFWFLRSYKTHSHVYAALAGIGAAACMMGKYWSIFLLAGLAVAALVDARRVSYFRSAAPWITVIVGFAVLAPHLAWLVRHDYSPISYALIVHGEKSVYGTVIAVLGYVAGSLGYVAIPVIVVLAAARPSRAAMADMLWPADTERRLAAAAFWAPLLLPLIAAPPSGIEITSLWSMSAWTLLPVMLLSSPAVRISAVNVRRILMAAVVLPFLLLIAAPVVAYRVHRNDPNPAAAHGQLMASQVERLWREATPQPLRYVGGDSNIVFSVVAYAADRPRALGGLQQPSAAELAQSGMALVCFVEDGGCVRTAQARAPAARRVEVDIVRDYLGQPGKPQRYTIVIVPPRP